MNRSTRAPSVIRAGTPLNGSVVGSGAATPTYAAPTPSQFEGAFLKNRNLGQDILPSPGQPKRTESLYVAPTRGPSGSGGGGGVVPKVSLYFLTITLLATYYTYMIYTRARNIFIICAQTNMCMCMFTMYNI